MGGGPFCLSGAAPAHSRPLMRPLRRPLSPPPTPVLATADDPAVDVVSASVPWRTCGSPRGVAMGSWGWGASLTCRPRPTVLEGTPPLHTPSGYKTPRGPFSPTRGGPRLPEGPPT